MAKETTETGPQTSPLNKLGAVYSKYLPADRETFEIRFSIISLIVSMFGLQLFLMFIWFRETVVFSHAFYIIVGSLHFGLYHGMKTGKLRLITPWLMWKILEIIFSIIIIIRGTTERFYCSKEYIVLAFVILAFDFLMMFCLYKNRVETSEVSNFRVDSESKKSTPDV